MTSPASRIALSAALSIASLTAPAVHADDGATEAPPPKEDAGIHSEEPTTGDDLILELLVDELTGELNGGCWFQCCRPPTE